MYREREREREICIHSADQRSIAGPGGDAGATPVEGPTGLRPRRLRRTAGLLKTPYPKMH